MPHHILAKTVEYPMKKSLTKIGDSVSKMSIPIHTNPMMTILHSYFPYIYICLLAKISIGCQNFSPRPNDGDFFLEVF